MMPPTIQSLELEVERMKCCYSMSGGMCDNTLSMYTIDGSIIIRIRILIVKYMELMCKWHAYFQVVKDDN